MTSWDLELLDRTQSEYVARLLGAPVVIEDLSWGLVDTKVLHVRADDVDFVVKAAPVTNHHIGREITAHETYTEPLVRLARTGQLVAADRAVNILISTYQPGTLVEGTSHEFAPDVHAQAGSALRAFHNQHSRLDGEYEIRATEKANAWLDRKHRIAPAVEAEARRVLSAYRPASIVVAPTHGDWQPRNWLIERERVRVIDFGRFDFRPPATDFCRLATQQWKELPALEAAFLDGYGADPREAHVWSMDLLREAIGTAVWAFLVGDVEFETQGHRMLEDAISRF
ncbi:phosphotransferase [Arthrobacter sp. TMT4-20]